MTEPRDETQDRLRRLAERQAARGPGARAAAARDTAPARRSRRAHAAGASRILAAGLSTSALFAIVTAMAVADPAASTTGPPEPPAAPEPTTSATDAPAGAAVTVVVREIHRTVFVDEDGNPVDAATAMARLAGPAPTAAPAPPAPSAPERVMVRAPAPAPAPPAPRCSGSKCP